MTGCGVAISIGMMPHATRSRPSPVRDLRHASRCSARTSLRLTTRKKKNSTAIHVHHLVALEANPPRARTIHGELLFRAPRMRLAARAVRQRALACGCGWSNRRVTVERMPPRTFRRYDQIPVDVKGAFVDDVIPAPLSGTFASLPLPDFLQVLPSTRTLTCHPAGPVTRRACR